MSNWQVMKKESLNRQLCDSQVHDCALCSEEMRNRCLLNTRAGRRIIITEYLAHFADYSLN